LHTRGANDDDPRIASSRCSDHLRFISNPGGRQAMAADGAAVVRTDHLPADLLTGRLHLRLPIRPIVPAFLRLVTT
jgi:hypothetical protein